jgi:hypothetical protein
MCKSGFADGISFSKNLYASISKLDGFPKDGDSLFVQHIGTYLTRYAVSHPRRLNFDIHSWNTSNLAYNILLSVIVNNYYDYCLPYELSYCM